MRLIFKTFLLALALLLAPLTLAHTGIVASVPENNQDLQQAPAQMELTFSGPVLLARVELRGPDGARQDIDISELTEVSANFALALPEGLILGKYTARWTILGEDGHTMAGAISFTIQGP